jgi:excisionase family DNA binding protein
MPPILLSARELAQRLDVSYETILSWTHRGKIPTIRDGRNRLIFNLDTVVKSLRDGAPADPEDRKPIRPKGRLSDTSSQTNPIDVPAPDLITEGEAHQDLSGALKAAKEVRS